MEIYIKPTKKTALSAVETIYIKDVAEVFSESSLAEQVKNIQLLRIDSRLKKTYIVSVLDIIKAIDASLPGNTVNNVGEMDVLIEYSPKNKTNTGLLKCLKIIFVSAVLFVGGATAIMSFHTDAQIPTVFRNINYILFNIKEDNPLLVHIPYSIGLAAGIIVFFNHFTSRKITDDPTPIEVEMSLYDTDINDTIIDALNTQKARRQGK